MGKLRNEIMLYPNR